MHWNRIEKSTQTEIVKQRKGKEFEMANFS